MLPDRDDEGYLQVPDDWTPDIAKDLALELEVELTAERWQVVRLVREHFEERQTVPEARVMLRRMKDTMGGEKGTRRYLYTLFPGGYAQHACKIAGMRKPLKLMLDV